MNRQEVLQIAKPILFNTEMVRAILDGRKTATRRVVKPQPCKESDRFVKFIHSEDFGWEARFGNNVSNAVCDRKMQLDVGDILYVRETWGCYEKDWGDANYFVYKADYPDGAKGYWYEPEQINWCDLPKWRPSIHMSKEAARMFLKVTGVRCERLQDISEAEIKAEGIDTCSHCYHFNGECKDFRAARECKLQSAFIKTWNSTIKKQDLAKYGWEANPWVWVYEFERVVAE